MHRGGGHVIEVGVEKIVGLDAHVGETIRTLAADGRRLDGLAARDDVLKRRLGQDHILPMRAQRRTCAMYASVLVAGRMVLTSMSLSLPGSPSFNKSESWGVTVSDGAMITFLSV